MMDPASQRCKHYKDLKLHIQKHLDDKVCIDVGFFNMHLSVVRKNLIDEPGSAVADAALDFLEHCLKISNDDNLNSVLKEFVIKNDPGLQQGLNQAIRRSILKAIENNGFNIQDSVVIWKNYNLELFENAFDKLCREDLTRGKCKKLFMNFIIPSIMNMDIENDIRNILINISFTILPLAIICDLTDEEFEIFSASVSKTYIKAILDLRDKEYENWHKLWVIIIRFCNKRLHHSMALTNILLRVVEYAFRNHSCSQRLRGYDCWIELINNASLSPAYLSSPKQLKLLMTPLKAKFSKQEEVIVKRFEVFVYLLEKLRDKAALCFTEFMEFCFGPVGANSDPNKNGQGIKVQVLWEKIVTVLLEMLGHTDNCMQKQFNFDPLVVNSENIAQLGTAVIKSVAECCSLLNSSQFENRDQNIKCLWESLLNLLNKSSDNVRSKCLETICLVLNGVSKDASGDKVIITNVFYAVIAQDFKMNSLTFKNTSNILVPIIFSKNANRNYDSKTFKSIINCSMENAKNFKYYLSMFNTIAPKQDINLSLACDFWVTFAKHILLNIHDNEDHQYSSYLMWPVQYYVEIDDGKIQDIYNNWISVYKKVTKDSDLNKIEVLDKLEELFRSNASYFLNILIAMEFISENSDDFKKDFVTRVMDILLLLFSYEDLQSESRQKLCQIFKMYLNPLLTFYFEGKNEEVFTKMCKCLEIILKSNQYQILEHLANFLDIAPQNVKTVFSNSLSTNLLDITTKENAVSDADLGHLKNILSLLKIQCSLLDKLPAKKEKLNSPLRTINVIENVLLKGPRVIRSLKAVEAMESESSEEKSSEISPVIDDDEDVDSEMKDAGEIVDLQDENDVQSKVILMDDILNNESTENGEESHNNQNGDHMETDNDIVNYINDKIDEALSNNEEPKPMDDFSAEMSENMENKQTENNNESSDTADNIVEENKPNTSGHTEDNTQNGNTNKGKVSRVLARLNMETILETSTRTRKREESKEDADKKNMRGRKSDMAVNEEIKEHTINNDKKEESKEDGHKTSDKKKTRSRKGDVAQTEEDKEEKSTEKNEDSKKDTEKVSEKKKRGIKSDVAPNEENKEHRSTDVSAKKDDKKEESSEKKKKSIKSDVAPNEENKEDQSTDVSAKKGDNKEDEESKEETEKISEKKKSDVAPNEENKEQQSTKMEESKEDEDKSSDVTQIEENKEKSSAENYEDKKASKEDIDKTNKKKKRGKKNKVVPNEENKEHGPADVSTKSDDKKEELKKDDDSSETKDIEGLKTEENKEQTKNEELKEDESKSSNEKNISGIKSDVAQAEETREEKSTEKKEESKEGTDNTSEKKKKSKKRRSRSKKNKEEKSTKKADKKEESKGDEIKSSEEKTEQSDVSPRVEEEPHRTSRSRSRMSEEIRESETTTNGGQLKIEYRSRRRSKEPVEDKTEEINKETPLENDSDVIQSTELPEVALPVSLPVSLPRLTRRSKGKDLEDLAKIGVVAPNNQINNSPTKVVASTSVLPDKGDVTPTKRGRGRPRQTKALESKQGLTAAETNVKELIKDPTAPEIFEDLKPNPEDLKPNLEDPKTEETKLIGAKKSRRRSKRKSDVAASNQESDSSDSSINKQMRKSMDPPVNDKSQLSLNNICDRKMRARNRKGVSPNEENKDTANKAKDLTVSLEKFNMPAQEETEDIIESSQDTTVSITPISSPKKLSRTSISPVTRSYNSDGSGDTVTPSEADSTDSNLRKMVIKDVMKLDLPERPTLTDSEQFVSQMDTVTLLSDQLVFQTSSKNLSEEKTVINDDLTSSPLRDSEDNLPSTPVSAKLTIPTSPVTGDTPIKTKELLDDTLDISPISSQNEQDLDEEIEPVSSYKRLLLKKTDPMMSPSSSKMMKMLPFATKGVNLQEEFDKEDLEDVYRFTRPVPSPLAVPKSGILKRKISDVTDDESLPCAKKKKVLFSESSTSSNNLISDCLDSDYTYSHMDTDTAESESSLQQLNDFLLDNTKPIYPNLVNCEDDVLKVLKTMTNPMVAGVWQKEIEESYEVKTVGNLASKTETEVNKLPFKSPVVSNVYKALNSYYFRKIVNMEDSYEQIKELFNIAEDKVKIASFILSSLPKHDVQAALDNCNIQTNDIKDFIQKNGKDKVLEVMRELYPETNISTSSNTSTKITNENTLAQELALKSTKQLLDFQENIFSNMSERRKHDTYVKIFKFLSDKIPEHRLLELHIDFLKTIQMKKP
ncbi:unnamed protein product [Brassicogethes aeneus]|uniref:Telomere-associated protein RIF1 n=1 Tax=Brassicogethes aeneus TaxID=1431903 RepID=A0A9P0B5U5_BRAAE|nr:unnamed protein product [Brassicogethes aeneus]